MVWTDLEKADRVTLVVILERGVVASPPLVFLGPLAREPSAPVQSLVTIMRQKGSFHVTGVTVNDPKLQAKLQTVREGQEYRVLISYAGGWEPGLVQKMLAVATDDPKQPVIKVPIQAIVQSSTAALTTATAR
jgi:hypothetical protein